MEKQNTIQIREHSPGEAYGIVCDSGVRRRRRITVIGVNALVGARVAGFSEMAIPEEGYRSETGQGRGDEVTETENAMILRYNIKRARAHTHKHTNKRTGRNDGGRTRQILTLTTNIGNTINSERILFCDGRNNEKAYGTNESRRHTGTRRHTRTHNTTNTRHRRDCKWSNDDDDDIK